MISRNCTKRSNSGPSQAAVASAFALIWPSTALCFTRTRFPSQRSSVNYVVPLMVADGAAGSGVALLDAEAVQQALVLAPAAAHAHAQVEEDLAPQQRFHLLAGRGADRADHLAALAHQDPLLRLGLGPRVRGHADQAVLALLQLVDLDLDRVRDLVVRAVQDLLADDLREPDLERQVRLLV